MQSLNAFQRCQQMIHSTVEENRCIKIHKNYSTPKQIDLPVDTLIPMISSITHIYLYPTRYHPLHTNQHLTLFSPSSFFLTGLRTTPRP